MKIIYPLAALTSFFLIAPSHAQAYLDPGSGSFIIQVVIASLVSGGIFLKSFWSRLTGTRQKSDKKDTSDDSQE